MNLLKAFFKSADENNVIEIEFPRFTKSPFAPVHESEAPRPDLTITPSTTPEITRTSYFASTEKEPASRPSSEHREPETPATPGKLACKQPASSRVAQLEPKEEEAPEWLAVFFDLAWTATFSNLTSNTQLTDLSTLFAYIVFFVLAWWLWAAQVHYNVKYHTDDWYHRIMMFAQLFIFGAMSAFTKDFNPFSRSVNPKLSAPQDFPADEYTRKAMLGISGLFACTRGLLFFSYVRLYAYARYSTNPVVKTHCAGLVMFAVSYLTSTLFFASAFTVVKYDLSPLSFWVRLGFWLCGIGAEVIVFIYIKNKEEGLLNKNTTSQRLITLTTIILGEGLNSNAGALVLAASLIGFLPNAARTAVSITFIIGLSLVLYTAGIQKSVPHTKITVLLHFPLHLALIVLLEALKNLLTLLSLLATIQYLADRGAHRKPGESDADALDAAFSNLGLDLKAIAAPLFSGNPSKADVNELVNKAVAQAYLKIFQNYQLADDAFIANFTEYIQASNGSARYDQASIDFNDFSLSKPINNVINQQRNSVVWIPISAGIFLFSLGVVLLVGDERRQRFVTSAAISRCLVGVIVALTAIAIVNEDSWKMLTRNGGLAHIVAGTFAFQYVMEILFLWLTVRDQRPAKALTCPTTA